MKRKIAILATLVLAVAQVLAGCGSGSAASSSGSQPSAASSKADDKNLSGTVTMWSTVEEPGHFLEGFNKLYPNIKVDITTIRNEEFLSKLMPALSAGQDVPDIFTGESTYIKYLVNTPYWDDLRNEPYNIKQYTENMWDYVVSVGTDSQGAIKALSYQVAPGSILYRRDMARATFGTDDPKEISGLLSTSEKMMDAAKKLKGKGYKMYASWLDLLNMQYSNRKSPWVVDGKLVIDPLMLNFMETAKTIASNGYALNTTPWAPEWVAAVEGNDVFCYVLPSWGYEYVIRPNAKKTAGQWGIAEGPVPYVSGGTWLGIYKDSPNKEQAWKFLEYVTCNADAQTKYAKDYGEFVSLKSVDEEMAKGAGEKVLAGQNPYAFYADQMKKLPGDYMTPYDQQINAAYQTAVTAYVNGKLDKDAALKQFKADVLNAVPELTVD